MSTDLLSRRRAGLTALALVAGTAGCSQRTATRLEALCTSPPAAVVVPVTLMVDSVRPAAPLQLRQDRGRGFDVTLTLLAGEDPALASCPDRSGIVTYDDGLPQALAGASAGSGRSVWRFEGASVVVDFAPQFRDNNLRLALPLTGSEGEWSLSTIAGNVAQGRALRR